MMKYNEKVERFAPKLGRKNLANGLSCPPFVYMDDSDDGMWVHYAKYCENIAKQKYKRCLAMAKWCRLHDEFTQSESERLGLPQRAIFMEYRRKAMWWNKWHKRWLELAEKFKPNSTAHSRAKENKMEQAEAKMNIEKAVERERAIFRTSSEVVCELAIERNTTCQMLTKLKKAIEANPEAVSAHHKELWRKQAKAMQEYVDVLGERIKDLIDNG